MITFTEANKFSIKKYLESHGINPVKDRGYYGLYHSPFREDHNASMKVDYNKNLWIDYGTNEGGTITDLIMRMNNCTNKEAIELLEKQLLKETDTSFSFHGNKSLCSEPSKPEPAISIQRITPLSNPALFQYLNDRHINTDIAKQYCKEVYYSVNGKNYFAIGFQNNTGGYDIRSSYFKGCTSKDITTLNTESNRCLVFEGFMDMLSYLTLKKMNQPDAAILVLNSISTISKAIDYLKPYKEIYTFLDNDEAGRKTTQVIKSACSSVFDQSLKYSEYKDLNDLLCGKKLAESKQAEMKERKLSGKEIPKQENKKSCNQISAKKKPGRRMKF